MELRDVLTVVKKSLITASSSFLFSSIALAQSPYSGLKPIAGDAHQHAGSLLSNFQLHQLVEGIEGGCPHNSGSPLDVYDHHRSVDYDFVIITHHDRVGNGGLTGVEAGTGSGNPRNKAAYQWWTDPNSVPIYGIDMMPVVTPDPQGFKDHQAGGYVDPPWNEVASFSSAADFKNDIDGGFLAISGREYTNANSWPTGYGANEGGHKVVVLPGPTERICGSMRGFQGRENDCADERNLYPWVYNQGGILIQAHLRDRSLKPLRMPMVDYPVEYQDDYPAGIKQRIAPFHPEDAPAGMSDHFVQGVEVATVGGIKWELGYQHLLQNGYRVFPSYGSDKHDMGLDIVSAAAHCETAIPGVPAARSEPKLGGVICWVPENDATRADLVQAMRDRNCYVARTRKPRLEYEMRDALGDAPVPMGSLLSVSDGAVFVTIRATNDPANLAHRFDRLELVDQDGTVKHSIPCTRDAINGDSCSVVDFELQNTADGAYYPRVCELSGTKTACSEVGDADTSDLRVIGAPIFVNWDAFNSTIHPDYDPSCDWDEDGIPCYADNCWNTYSDGTTDSDGDGFGDACDNCKSTPNPDQTPFSPDCGMACVTGGMGCGSPATCENP